MKQEDKIALRQWEEFHRSLISNMVVDTTLSARDIQQERERLERDPVEWIKFFFPKYAKYEFTPFHKAAIRRVLKNAEWYEVLSWSRELAKSTIAMFILMYLVMTGRKRFIILASITETAAVRLLTPYRLNFENNPRIKQFYGEQMNFGDWSESEFCTKDGAKFLALGAGSEPRGARTEEVRPDVLYMDDYDSNADCRNPETLKKKWEWFERALYPTRSISEPLLVLWCGNIIAKDCCITRAGKKADSWDIVNIRDKNGKSTWPEKNTEEFIDRALAKITQSAIQAEYYNNPISEGAVFKKMVFGKVPPLNRFPFLVAYGDPAYSDSKSKQSSTKSLWLMGKYQGNYYVIKGFLGRELNAGFISWYFDLREYVGGKATVYYYMENNKLQDPFYQQVFKPLLREECERRGVELYIRGDGRKKTDKATRIEANLEPLNRVGALIFNENEQDNPMMQELITQFENFELHLPYPADGPDSIEGGKCVIDDKVGELQPTYTITFAELNENNPHRM